MRYPRLPEKQGLYDPRFEKDSCGVGFVCDIKGNPSHGVVRKGIQVLNRLSHRGAVGADPETGDGAGILIQIPHEFFTGAALEAGIDLPGRGDYGTGLVFLPPDPGEREHCEEVFSRVLEEEGQQLLGWRSVPVDNTVLGHGARETEPVIEQVFIRKDADIGEAVDFERRLYVIRKRIENAIRSSDIHQKSFFYITNLSSRTFSYKGLLMPRQVEKFFLDLSDEKLASAICLVHSRFSTNTFPTWDLAQPFRYLAHNGEINTLRGNINWMSAREGLLVSELFGEDIEKIKPVIVPEGSDSATLDNVFELLLLSGRPLTQVVMMLISGAWENNAFMNPALRDFYRYHACFQEPWDGPAAIAFTDGTGIGAILDRNGLRPARYLVSKSGLAVMASEVGVLDIEPEDILLSGRLAPGKIFYVDTGEGRLIDNAEIKEEVSTRNPYSRWIRENMIDLKDLPAGEESSEEEGDILTAQKAFGYTREDLKYIIGPMARDGSEPVGAMGDDTPHAVLSQHPQLLYNYFKQLFAQVTNPAIDPIREKIVMSLESYVGPQKNLLSETPEHCRKLKVEEPILTDEGLAKIRAIPREGFKSRTISLLFKADGMGFTPALARICRETEEAIEEGCSFIILSDRGVDREKAPLPALLAVGAVHHHLVRRVKRTRIGIIVETGEPREVHHFALLLGYGADLINPYLAYRTVRHLADGGELDLDHQTALDNYRGAARKGILKILSKMGISTLNSYRGAQIFEALGLRDDLVDRCFAGTTSRIGGAGMEVIAREVLIRHQEAYPEDENVEFSYLRTGGIYRWKRNGEFHLWNPETITALREASRKGDREKYKEFARLVNDQSDNPTTLRSLLRFRESRPVPVAEVEPVEEIVKRFTTGAMSFGSISRGAHETLAVAMNRMGAQSNTGEGGEDPARFHPLPGGDTARSSIKQVASGRFGVTTNYLVNADEIQIKIAQGAKPGEGGQLPGHKVSTIIARTRYTTPGSTLISPPPHHDIYSIEDLAQLIFDLKNANPEARISVKLVSEVGVGTVAAGVAKGHADMILVSGGDGGTGASPKSSIKHAGLPWELGLAETHQTLVLNDLRSRVRLQADGQMRTGFDVAVAALLGAEEYGFSTSALIVMGCVMLRHCNLDNCSVGVATQDVILEKRFHGEPEHVVNYFYFVADELRDIMARLGMRSLDEMIGRVDLLEFKSDIVPWKAGDLDYSGILYGPEVTEDVGIRRLKAQDHGIGDVLDRKLIELSRPALEKGETVRIKKAIRNHNRTTGGMLSGEVCRLHGEKGLPEDSIYCKFKGEAGQSFGAWLARGVTFELEGMANDYVGKGMSGGKVIIYPNRKTTFISEENIIIGNTAFYGATDGEAYIRGLAGERFCIRNSGLNAVVEGVGDHGCEYMTGGRVLVLGKTGRNFAAGMSGGFAYVYDREGDFRDRCNLNMVELEEVDEDHAAAINSLLYNHHKCTGSPLAGKILENLSEELTSFVKVMPIEYKRVLEGMKV